MTRTHKHHRSLGLPRNWSISWESNLLLLLLLLLLNLEVV
jgi:hypothetical protein